MVLEAAMLVIDNTEFARNGDYGSSRYAAQLETVDTLFHHKVGSNPETTVGLMAYGGDGPQVLSSFTADYGKLLSGLHDTKIHGNLHFSTGIQVAALALKHRQNKVQHQRIIAFVASPIEEAEKDLEKLAKRMKKNNIAIDFINYGEDAVNSAKLEKFIATVNSNDNSHLVTVPSGQRSLREVVRSSAIARGDDGFGGADDAGGAGGAFDFGMDGEIDDELAMALRMSLEEEQQRQAREAREAQAAQGMETIQEDAVVADANANVDAIVEDDDADTDVPDATTTTNSNNESNNS